MPNIQADSASLRDLIQALTAMQRSAILIVLLSLLHGCALNCNTIRAAKDWSLIEPDSEVRQAREVAATDGSLHHTFSWGPESWYRHASGDLYRCEVMDGRLWGDKGTCRQYGMYFRKSGATWNYHTGVNSSCPR